MHDRPLPLEDRRTIDALRYAFKNALASDTPPRIEDQLAAVHERLRGPLLVDLLFLEIEHRRRRGDAPTVDEYRARFPESLAFVDEAFGDLSRVAKAPGAALPTRQLVEGRDGGVAKGLKVRCPYCKNTIELVPHAEMGAIDCPACGSHFSLVDTDATTRSARAVSELGHFRLVDRLGVGGFGTVWKALDTELDRSVAIKIPRSGHLSPEEEEQFLREARSSAQLNHPHIVSVHEVGREGDTIYIVSDFIRGVTLSDVIAGSRLSTREAVAMVRKLADALRHAHDRGIVHRDVKPQNVMVDDFGEPHLMDFGVAKRDAGEVTITLDGVVLGTPAYMSPEQAGGEAHRVDGRTDVYSLGVALYQMLTGELPFRGAVRMLIHQVLNDPPPSPCRYDASVPRDLETIILKCLEKDPGRRYQTAGELGDELQRWMVGEPILARPVSRVEKAWRWMKKNPMPAAVLGLICVLAIGGPTVAVRESRLLYKNSRLLYGNEIGAVYRDWTSGDNERAVAILRGTNPEFRGWEYDYLRARLERNLKTLRRHDYAIQSIASSPDNRLIATAGGGSKTLLWRLADGEFVREFETGADSDDADAVESAPTKRDEVSWHAQFDRSGSRLITASRYSGARIWDVSSGSVLQTFGEPDKDHGVMLFAVLSPDDRLVATGNRNRKEVEVWDLATEEVVYTLSGHKKWVWEAAFGPDGRTLVTGGEDAAVIFWDLSAPAPEPSHVRTPGHGPVYSVDFSRDGSMALSGHGGGKADIWDARDGRLLKTLDTQSNWGIDSVAFSPDATRVATSGRDNIVRLWDVRTGRRVEAFRGHTTKVPCVAFDRRGGRVISGGADRTVRIWDATKAPVATNLWGHRGPVASLAFARDEDLLVSAGDDGTVRVWRASADGVVLEGHGGAVSSVAVDAGGRLVASGGADGSLYLWEWRSGHIRHSLSGHASALLGIRFSRGDRLASVDATGGVRTWDAVSGDSLGRTQLGAGEGFECAVFDRGAGRLASGDRAGVVSVWDLTSESDASEFARPDEEAAVQCLAFSPNGRRVAAGHASGSLVIWDLSSGASKARRTAHDRGVKSVAFSRDGERIISGGGDGEVAVWWDPNPESVQELVRIGVDTQPVTAVAVGPEGQQIACGVGKSGKKLESAIGIWNPSRTLAASPGED